MTKTEQIFELNAPFDNPFQGSDRKMLFVCSAGILRSATAARIFAAKGFNTRACGSAGYALIPISANLIAWADTIVFVNKENYKATVDQFQFKLSQELAVKLASAQVLSIPDMFDYMHPELIRHLEEQVTL